MTTLHPHSSRAGVAMLACVLLAGPSARAVSADDHRAHQHHEVMPSADPIPGESIYQLKVNLTDQNDKQTALESLRGRPALITMFYTSCQGVCPMLALTLKRMEDALTPQQRSQLRVAMISFDPQRDTPRALSEFGEAHKVDPARWVLARTSEDSVRELAAVLGVRYRPLPNGVYSHSATIFLLDADGLIRAHTENLQALDPQFMAALRAMLDSPPRQ